MGEDWKKHLKGVPNIVGTPYGLQMRGSLFVDLGVVPVDLNSFGRRETEVRGLGHADFHAVGEESVAPPASVIPFW